jgi:hypothetical protein
MPTFVFYLAPFLSSLLVTVCHLSFILTLAPKEEVAKAATQTLTAKRTLLKFIIKIENFNILKPQAGPKKVPSYAVESSKHPLILMRLSL